MTLFEDKTKAWTNQMIALGHEPRMDENGDLDIFAFETDYHNGPECIKCGNYWCWHCVDAIDIEPCQKTSESVNNNEV